MNVICWHLPNFFYPKIPLVPGSNAMAGASLDPEHRYLILIMNNTHISLQPRLIVLKEVFMSQTIFEFNASESPHFVVRAWNKLHFTFIFPFIFQCSALTGEPNLFLTFPVTISKVVLLWASVSLIWLVYTLCYNNSGHKVTCVLYKD